MKRIILSIFSACFFSSLAYSAGPIYRHKEAEKQLEFENVYQDIKSIPRTSSNTLPSGSTQYIQNTNTLQTGATAYPDFVAIGKLLNLNGLAGSSGTFVVSQGQNAPPIWSNYGRILQVVTSTMVALTQQTTASASYSSTTLNVALTPVQLNSMVLIFVSQSFGASGVAGTVCTARIRRDSTQISILNDEYAFVDDSATESDSAISLLATDIPGDTNRHIYNTAFARSAGTGTCISNTSLGSVGGNGGFMIAMEISQ